MTNQSFAGKFSIKKLSAIVIAVVLLVTIFTGSAYAQTSDDYSVSIVDSTRTIAVTTSETEPIEILKQAFHFLPVTSWTLPILRNPRVAAL